MAPFTRKVVPRFTRSAAASAVARLVMRSSPREAISIHAVGPVWRGGDEHEPELLASAYRRSLQVAAQHGLHSISIPSISTGAFVYPIRLAAPIALKTIITFLEGERHSLDEVRMVLYTREDNE